MAFRAVQGLGGAIMFPAALAIVVQTFELRSRGRALALFFGIAGGLTAFGQDGIERVIDILRAELNLTMRQCGTPTIAEKARQWYNSPAYEVIKPIRLSATKGRMFIVEGLAPQ